MPGKRLPRDPHGFDTVDRSILAGVANGATNTEIAFAMNMSVNTVQNRMVRAMGLLRARNRAHLAALFVRTYEVARARRSA
jgi:DNA-binding NarL/FixJ family response regulator